MKDIPSYAQALMADLGPQTQAVDSVGFDGELGAWCVGFENESMLLLEWFGEQESFLLHAELGAPPAQGQLAAFQAALAYNAMWRENGGAHIGMVGGGGELALMLALPARSLTLAQLQQVLLGMASLAEHWRQGIAQSGSDGAGEPAMPSPMDRV